MKIKSNYSNLKNILLVIDSLGSGGAQNQLTLLAVGLKSRGYNVAVFTYFDLEFFKYRLVDANIPIVYVPKKGKVGWNVIKKLAKVIDGREIDSIISYMHTPNIYATIAKSLAKLNPQLIISYRSHTVFEQLSRTTLAMRKYVNRKADHIVSNSHHERKKWISAYPKLKTKFFTIYNCVDDRKYSAKEHIKRSNTFLVVGSVGPAKNGLIVLEALNILKNRGIQANVKWIGKKVFSIPARREYLDRMNALIHKYDLSNQWEWCDPTQNLIEEYISHKALVLASTVEGLPNVVCEALSCATPCIVSDVLDHPLIIEDGRNGFLFDPTKENSLADAMNAMLKISDSNYTRMKSESLKKANDLFKTESMIGKYLNIICNDK